MPMMEIIDFSMRLLSFFPMMQIIDVPGASTRKGGKQMSMEQPDRSHTHRTMKLHQEFVRRRRKALECKFSKSSKSEASTEASKDALVRNGADFVTFKLQFMESSRLRHLSEPQLAQKRKERIRRRMD